MAVMELDMAIPAAMGCHIRRALLRATRVARPFPHWLPRDVLPEPAIQALRALPFEPVGEGDTQGKRETRNSNRVFISESLRAEYSVCARLADAFQDDATVGLLEDLCGTRLKGGFTRIEYCMDTDGFWLEPHTDIGAKMLTFLVYLSDHPDAEDWGTDIMDRTGRVLSRAPGTANHGLIFVPGGDTWHGWAKRPLAGVRRSLIVNYVKPEWRSRHELAFPTQAVVPGSP